MPMLDFTMPLFALTRGNYVLLDILLEMGASTDYVINGKPVDDNLKRKSFEINEVHLKHERWRRLR